MVERRHRAHLFPHSGHENLRTSAPMAKLLRSWIRAACKSFVPSACGIAWLLIKGKRPARLFFEDVREVVGLGSMTSTNKTKGSEEEELSE